MLAVALLTVSVLGCPILFGGGGLGTGVWACGGPERHCPHSGVGVVDVIGGFGQDRDMGVARGAGVEAVLGARAPREGRLRPLLPNFLDLLA